MQADLDKLEFTDLCIRETLRLYPTAPIIASVATKPNFTLSFHLSLICYYFRRIFLCKSVR